MANTGKPYGSSMNSNASSHYIGNRKGERSGQAGSIKGFNKPPSSKAIAGYRKPYADSNTAPKIKRLSPSPNKLNATGKRGTMTMPKQGSGRAMTNKTKGYAKRDMY